MASGNGLGLPPFDSQTMRWEEWLGLLEFIIESEAITDPSKKRAELFKRGGLALYSQVSALVVPKNPKEVTYDEIVAALNQHYDQCGSELYSRNCFKDRDQQNGESIREYVAALKEATKGCNFRTWTEIHAELATNTNPTMLPIEVVLRDRLVFGVCDSQLRQRLLTEKSLTFIKAVDIAQAAELAAKEQKGNKVPSSADIFLQQKQKTINCFRCGENHFAKDCTRKDLFCEYCTRSGHLEKVCRSKFRSSGKQKLQHSQVRNVNSVESDAASMYDLFTISQLPIPGRIELEVKIDGTCLVMQVDSGAAVSIVSEETFKSLYTDQQIPVLEKSNILLRTWGQESSTGISVIGTTFVRVQFKDRIRRLPLVVAAERGVSLIGRNWFDSLGIGMYGVNEMTLNVEASINKLLEKYKDVFMGTIGNYTGAPLNIEIKADVKPKFLRARRVPFALKEPVERELVKLQEQGIITPVRTSEWATPIVVVRKKDGKVRICADYRSTVNPVLEKSDYQLPTAAEIMSSMTGKKIFSRIDLKQAYQQLKVNNESARVLTINTHKGLFLVNSMPFGITSGPHIFQHLMDSDTLNGVEDAHPFQDDILIATSTMEEHLHTLDVVMQRLSMAGLSVNKEKCKFIQRELEFLGFKINETGIWPTDEKIKAIKEAPNPTTKEELQSWLGMTSFYSHFLKDKATIAEPLYRLLDKKNHWNWSHKHEKAFTRLKSLLHSHLVLAHYDPSRSLFLNCDASSYGLGAVLTQKDELGTERPVAFASRTLGKSEKNYSQFDKEGAAIVYGMKHFHQYIAGRPVTITTDHKPLLGVMSPGKPIPEIISPRMLRWCILLGAYDYNLVYRKGSENCNADALSRLPLPSSVDEAELPGDVLMLDALKQPPYQAKELAELTNKDRKLRLVYQAVLQGKLHSLEEQDYLPFRRRFKELSCLDGVLLWGTRVVVPEVARHRILELLHANHPGIVAMKATARSHVWWPNIDSEIQSKVERCHSCQLSRHSQPKINPAAWPEETEPWNRIHIDFAGPLDGNTFLVIVDAYSKWTEVRRVHSQNAETIIKELRSVFAIFGLPRIVVSDNGPGLVAEATERFCLLNGVKHVTSSPYHPATNGQAERMVDDLKCGLAKMTSGTIDCRLSRYLIKQHTTVHSKTGMTPAQRMFGRELRTALDMVHPTRKPEGEEQYKGNWNPGDLVYVRNFLKVSTSWIPAKIVHRVGHRSFKVVLSNGTISRRHVNHIKKRWCDGTDTAVESPAQVNHHLIPQPIVDQVLSKDTQLCYGVPQSIPEHSNLEEEEFLEDNSERQDEGEKQPEETDQLTSVQLGESDNLVSTQPEESDQLIATQPEEFRSKSERKKKPPAHLKDYLWGKECHVLRYNNNK